MLYVVAYRFREPQPHHGAPIPNRRPESVAARIEPFLEVVRSWPIKVDPITLLSWSPQLLVGHSDVACYGDRIKLLAEWLPPGLDLTQVWFL